MKNVTFCHNAYLNSSLHLTINLINKNQRYLKLVMSHFWTLSTFSGIHKFLNEKKSFKWKISKMRNISVHIYGNTSV